MGVDNCFRSRDFFPGDDVSSLDANEGVVAYESRDFEVFDFIGGRAGGDIPVAGGVGWLAWGWNPRGGGSSFILLG